jgi:hypothetical protein
MTVAELIKALRQLPQDLPVMSWTREEFLEPIKPPRAGQETWWHPVNKQWVASPVVVIEGG